MHQTVRMHRQTGKRRGRDSLTLVLWPIFFCGNLLNYRRLRRQCQRTSLTPAPFLAIRNATKPPQTFGGVEKQWCQLLNRLHLVALTGHWVFGLALSVLPVATLFSLPIRAERAVLAQREILALLVRATQVSLAHGHRLNAVPVEE